MNARNPLVDHIFRVATSAIFVVAGLGHFMRPEQMIEKLSHGPLSVYATDVVSAELLVVLTGVPLVLGGLALALGFQVRWAAILLAVVLIPMTLTAHLGHIAGVGPLFKNVALLGALLHFATYGSSKKA